MKTLVKYIVVILICGTIGGLLTYALHPLFYDEHLAPGESILHDIFFGVVSSVFTLLIFSIMKLLIRPLEFSSLWLQDLLCLLIVISVGVMVTAMTFGVTAKGVMYMVMTLGLANFIIPHLEAYLSFNKPNRE